jgi:hypothetical protein
VEPTSVPLTSWLIELMVRPPLSVCVMTRSGNRDHCGTCIHQATQMDLVNTDGHGHETCIL